MNISKRILFLLVYLPFAINAIGQTKWQANSGTVTFKIKNAGFVVNGDFSGFTSTILFDADKPAGSSISGTVQVATINTGNESRDEHLRAGDYFDVNKYKTITITSTDIFKTKEAFAGHFNLTIKDKTLPVVIPFTFTNSGNDAVFKGNFTINRRDFGVGGNSWILSDNVAVSIVVNAKK